MIEGVAPAPWGSFRLANMRSAGDVGDSTDPHRVLPHPHPLKPTSASRRAEATCSVCSDTEAEVKLSCEACDYDVCAACNP